MSTITNDRDLDSLADRGTELFEHQIKPALRPADDGKFVAIDVRSGEYELDFDDYAAVNRLRTRLPSAEVWLERAGFPTAYRIGGLR